MAAVPGIRLARSSMGSVTSALTICVVRGPAAGASQWLAGILCARVCAGGQWLIFQLFTALDNPFQCAPSHATEYLGLASAMCGC